MDMFDMQKLLLAYQADLNLRKLLGHIQNLKSNVQPNFFAAYRKSLISSLPRSYMPLLRECCSFRDFAQLMSLVDDDERSAILGASEPFCKRYNTDPEFWEQWQAVHELNGDRNLSVYSSVAESADAVLKAARERGKFPQAEAAWAMLGALASYAKEHAEELDPDVKAEHDHLCAITARSCQLLLNS